MTEPPNALRDLVIRRRIELGVPGKPAAFKTLAMRSGGRISHEIIRQIEQGTHSGRLGDERVEGLALALGVPVQQVYDAARVPKPGTRWRWNPKYDRLPDDDRRLVEALASRLLALHEQRARRAE